MKKLLNSHVFLSVEFLSQTAFKRKNFYKNVKMAPARDFHCHLVYYCSKHFILGRKKEPKEEQKPVLELDFDQLRNVVSYYRDIKKAKSAGYDTEVTGYRTQIG